MDQAPEVAKAFEILDGNLCGSRRILSAGDGDALRLNRDPSGYGGNRTNHLDFLARMEAVKPGIGLRRLERGDCGAEAAVTDRQQGITREVIGGSGDDSADGYRLAAMSRAVIGRFTGANLFQRKLFLRGRGERKQRRTQPPPPAHTSDCPLLGLLPWLRIPAQEIIYRQFISGK